MFWIATGAIAGFGAGWCARWAYDIMIQPRAFEDARSPAVTRWPPGFEIQPPHMNGWHSKTAGNKHGD